MRREAQRLENVRILLRTLNDIYPGPTAPRMSPESGPAPSTRVPCDLCHRSGRVYDPSLKQIRICPVCEGYGWRKRRAGDQEWDENTGQLIATDVTQKKPEPMSPAQLDATIHRLQVNALARDGEVDPDDAYSWERDRIARDKEASYRELEQVLGVMQIEHTLGRTLINDAYLSGLCMTLPRAIDELLILWIANRMPRKIRIPKRFYEAQQAALKEEAKERLARGEDLVELAQDLEISVGRLRDLTDAGGTLRVSFGNASGERHAPAPELG